MMTSCTYSYGFSKTRDKNIAVYRFPANCNKRNFIGLFKCAYCLFFNCSSLTISIHKFLTGFYSFLFRSIATMSVYARLMKEHTSRLLHPHIIHNILRQLQMQCHLSFIAFVNGYVIWFRFVFGGIVLYRHILRIIVKRCGALRCQA